MTTKRLITKRDIDNFEDGVSTLLKELFGLLAPFATAFILPNDLVKKSTIKLVS